MATPCLICCADGATAEFECPLCPQAACVDCWCAALFRDRAGLRCFDCKRPWVVETLLSAPSFAPRRAAILGHAGDIEVEKEFARLPACQEEAAVQRELRRLREEKAALGSLKRLRRRFRKSQAAEAEAALAAHRESMGALLRQMYACQARSELTPLAKPEPKPPNKEAPVVYVQRCDDPCRGFVRASDFACSVCERRACRKCGGSGSAGHTCDPAEVATFEERRKNHKLCPACHVEIYRAYGCDQMFCVNCHTAFSWSTLAIDRGTIHNPEYFRYLAEARASEEHPEEDAACGELPAYEVFVSRMPNDWAERRFYEALYACVEHIRECPLLAGGRKDNLDLRVAFVNGDFDEEQFRTKVKRRFQRDLKLEAFRELLRFVIASLIDSVRAMMITPTLEQVGRERRTLACFVKLVNHDVTNLLDIHGGELPREVDPIFAQAFTRSL